MTFPKMNKKRYIFLIIVAFLVFLFFRYWNSIAAFVGNVWQAVIPIVVGAIIAYILNILMSFYERHYFVKKNPPFAQKSRTAVCLIGAILTILLVFALIISLIIPQLINCIKLIIQKMPGAIEWISNFVKGLSWLPESIHKTVNTYMDKLLHLNWSVLAAKAMDFLKNGIASNKGSIGSVLSSTASVIVSVVIGIIFSIYFLACKEKILNYIHRFVNAVFTSKGGKNVIRFLSSFNKTFHKYIVAECIEAAILGILCFVCMLILRLPYAPMISAMVMLMALVPLVGSTISAVVGTLMILSVSPIKALIFFAMLMTVQVIEGNVIYPKVVGKGVGTPGIIVLTAVTVGGSIFDIVGMLIGVPIASTIWSEMKLGLARREKKAALLAAADGGEAPPPAPEPESEPEPVPENKE